MAEPDEFQHFVSAQSGCSEAVAAEILAGRKQSHWMWFVFPQLSGLGSSPTARRFSIEGLDQARRYLAHPVLGKRLVEMAQLLLSHSGQRPQDILGDVDAMKLRSSVTLFSRVPAAPAVFRQVLDEFYDGRECEKTLCLLGLES